MKIISKWKDYYDYLQGIYGVDPKIVLDRRQFNILTLSHGYWGDAKGYSLFICGKRIDFAYTKRGEFLYLDELKDRYPEYKGDSTLVKVNEYDKLLTQITPGYDKYNLKYNCPMILTPVDEDFPHKYPKLDELKFQKVMPPQQIYLLLSEWLAPKENIVDTRTNKEKITSQGFDLKTSFRNVK